MARALNLTAVYETVEDGWIQARVEELPEVITAAATREEAEEMLKDAVLEFLASLGQPGSTSSPGTERKRFQVKVSA